MYRWPNLLIALAILSCLGCSQGQFGQANNQNPFAKNGIASNGANPSIATDQANQLNESLASTIQQLNQKLSQFDTTNQELHAEQAQLRKQLAVSSDEKNLLKQQMRDTLTKYKELLAAKTEVDGRLTAIQASSKTRYGAEVRANNSLLGKLQQLNLSGIEATEDGDVIRVFLPSDKLFQPGSYSFKTTGQAMLDQVAIEIKRNFPRQIIGVEGHLDPTVGNSTTSAHQISATQALAVFDYYRVSHSLNAKQMFILGQGANRPRFSNANEQARQGNRRIEVVIYPESFQ